MKDGTRNAKHKSSLGRRILSAVLVMVMCFSLMQVGAYAEVNPAQTQAQKQILGGTEPQYYTWDANSKAFSGTASTGAEVVNGQHWDVVISKSIAATGVENEFEITLDVQTNQTIEENITYPNVAVTLVLDVSTSMSDADMETMKNALTANGAFLDKLAANANGAKRMVSVVAFCKNATLKSGWVDITDADNLKDVKAVVRNLGKDGGTNTYGGLLIAKNLLEQDVVSPDEFAYRYVVLMTDGVPNTIVTKPNVTKGNYNGTYYNYDQPIDLWKSEDKYQGVDWWTHPDFKANVNGKTSYGDPYIYSAYRAQKIAEEIRVLSNTELYAIGYGNSLNDWIYQADYTNWRDTLEKGEAWLAQKVAEQSDHYFKADMNGLSTVFQSIVNEITVQAGAWMVTDPMGEYIILDTESLKDIEGVHVNGSVLQWNLRQAKGVDGHYTMKYKVKLNVPAIIDANAKNGDDAVEEALKKYYLTNGETSLTYYIQDENGDYLNDAHGKLNASELENALMTMYFKVPAVKGYAAKLGFTKVGSDGNLLQGAQFELTNKSGTWSDAATSGANGQVTYKKWIPSGDTYILTETDAPDGYMKIEPVEFTLSYGEGIPAFNGGQVVDKLKTAYTDVTITKTWRSPGGQTPDAITVTLKQNGTAMPEYTDFVINKGDCTINNGIWSYTFKNLIALDENGKTYTYTVEENVPEGYKVEGQDTLNLINTATGKVNVIVTKEWLLPDTMNTTTALVDVILYANGQEAARKENVHDGETVSFMNLEQYDENGQTIIYTVGEECDTAYQQVAIDKTAEAGPTTMYTIVNTVTDETDVTVSGTKIWKDGDDTESRPESITVELYADGNKIDTADVTAADNWQYSFTGLQRYNFTREGERITDVHEIVYTVEEVSEFDGYASSVVGSDIINTRVDKVDFTVTKEWAADLSGAEHGPVSVILYANGNPVAEAEPFEDSYTFTGLDKYDADGVKIEYYVIEVPVDGYTASYSGVITDNDGNYSQTITNTRDDADDTLTITVTKVWQQPGNADAQTATFELYKGEESTGKTLQITGNGVGYFENLPRYEEVIVSEATEDSEAVTALVEIDYNVLEVNRPANYKNTVSEELTADSAGNFTCNFVNTITGTTDIFVEKSWVKPSNIAAPEITVAVQKYDLDRGEWVTLNDAIVIKSGETNGSVKELPAYDADGRRISYRITELSVPGYSSAVNGGYNGQTGNYEYSIVNSINPSNSEITVSKQWLDGSRAASERPSVTLQLQRDGEAYDTVEFWYDSTAEKVMATTKNDTVDAIVSEDGNTYSVKLTVSDYSADLTMMHVYSLTEQDIPTGYTSVVNGYTATNTRIGTLDIDVTKYWTDPGNVDRPDISLILTGKVGDAEVKTYEIHVSDDGGNVSATMNGDVDLAVNANGNTWTITAAGLKQYHNGEKITYTLTEDAVNGYNSEKVDGQPFAINNVIVDPKNVSVSAEKKWANMEIEGVYQPTLPDSITVSLFRDGVKVEGTEQTVTKESEYAIQSYDNLEMYAPNGSRYSYQIMELNADGGKVVNDGIISFGENNDYTVTYGADGTITNTFVVPVKYMWIVKTNYVHKNYDGTILLDWGTQTEVYTEAESKTITVDPADYAVCPQDSLTYQLDTSKMNVTSVELSEENQLYELVLNYILTEEEPYIPPYVPPYIPPVDPPVDPPQEPPVTPPKEPVITPEEPGVPAGDKDIDDPLHNLNDGDIPMEGMEIEDPNVPKTADESNVNTWMLIALLSGMALAVSVLTERRQFKHKV